MNAGELLRHYERIADSPDAVTRLRRFVLELAVRGKLLPQFAGDEQSADLLALAGDASIVGNSLPRGWICATVGQLLDFKYGKGLAPGDRSTSGPTPVFGSNGVVGFTTTPLTDQPSIIVGRKGSAGALNICDGPSWTTDVAYYIEPPSFFQLRYLYLALSTLGLDALGKGVKPGLSRSDAYELELWVPPLAEQARIVTKVDELMALCDRLEAARAEREAARDRLTAATLARLNTPDPEIFSDDARFALDVLPALTARTDQIRQLRQTILNLAVRGKLVAQDPSDEPAAALLSQIAIEAAQQTLGNRVRKRRDLPALDVDRAPFNLPVGWVWARFPELGHFGRGKSKHRPRNDPALFEGGTHLVIQTGDVARSRGVIRTHTSKYNDVGVAQSHKWPAGTLCITIAANIADSGILAFDACFPDSVVGFLPSPLFDSARYFEYFVRTAKANLLEFAPATAQKNINLEILESVLIPLPPLNEQRRIVARIDELMALCDQMEQSLLATDHHAGQLLDALIHQALETTESLEIAA